MPPSMAASSESTKCSAYSARPRCSSAAAIITSSLATLWGVPSIGFSAMSHKVQGVAEWFGPLLKPVRNSTMLGMEWEETMAQAESYLAGGVEFRRADRTSRPRAGRDDSTLRRHRRLAGR